MSGRLVASTWFCTILFCSLVPRISFLRLPTPKVGPSAALVRRLLFSSCWTKLGYFGLLTECTFWLFVLGLKEILENSSCSFLQNRKYLANLAPIHQFWYSDFPKIYYQRSNYQRFFWDGSWSGLVNEIRPYLKSPIRNSNVPLCEVVSLTVISMTCPLVYVFAMILLPYRPPSLWGCDAASAGSPHTPHAPEHRRGGRSYNWVTI